MDTCVQIVADIGGTNARFAYVEHDKDELLGIEVFPCADFPFLVDAIRADQPFNEAERGIMASVTSSLGRRAAHCAQALSFDDMLNAEEEYAPGADQWTLDSPPPLASDEQGRYPVPRPGRIKKREY